MSEPVEPTENKPNAVPEAVIVGEMAPIRDGNSLAFEPISAIGASQVLQAEGYRGPYNREFSVGAVLVGLLGTLTWAVILGAASGAFDSIELG